MVICDDFEKAALLLENFEAMMGSTINLKCNTTLTTWF
jgi:hypothetical protein